MEISTGHSYQGELTPSDLTVKAPRRGSGRNYISSECKNRLDAFRFKGPHAHPAEEAHLQDICKSDKIPKGMGDLMSGSGGNDMTCPGGDGVPGDRGGGQEQGGHESQQTDYGSTTMFDDDEAWFHDQDEENCSKLGLIPARDSIGGTKAPGLFGQAAAPGSWLEPSSGSSGKITILPINVEGVLGQSPKCVRESLEDGSYGGSDGTPTTFERASNPWETNLGATSNGIPSTPCKRPHSSYDPTIAQLLPPFTEEGFFLDETISSALEHAAKSVKCRRLAKNDNDAVIVARCRVVDVVKNGKIRWIDVSGSARRAKKGAPGWLQCPDRNRIVGSIERPPFPAVVKERSPIHGLSADTTMKTCFCINDAVEVATLVTGAKFKGDVLVELFAKVLQNRTIDSGTHQKFQFCDIFSAGPPLLPGEYVVPRTCGPWDIGLKVFMGTAMVRVVGRMNNRNNAREWTLKIENIRDVDWDDVDWVKEVVCGNWKN